MCESIVRHCVIAVGSSRRRQQEREVEWIGYFICASHAFLYVMCVCCVIRASILAPDRAGPNKSKLQFNFPSDTFSKHTPARRPLNHAPGLLHENPSPVHKHTFIHIIRGVAFCRFDVFGVGLMGGWWVCWRLAGGFVYFIVFFAHLHTHSRTRRGVVDSVGACIYGRRRLALRRKFGFVTQTQDL